MTDDPADPTNYATAMWEARAEDGRTDDLVAFVVAHVDPSARIYRSADARVVVIDPTGVGPGEVPAELIARDPHVWHFQHVSR